MTRIRKYRNEWEKEEEFSYCIERHRTDETLAWCKLCQLSISCQKSAIKRHCNKSNTHKKAIAGMPASKHPEENINKNAKNDLPEAKEMSNVNDLPEAQEMTNVNDLTDAQEMSNVNDLPDAQEVPNVNDLPEVQKMPAKKDTTAASNLDDESFWQQDFPWIKFDDSRPSKVVCTKCDSYVAKDYSVLLRHLTTSKHLRKSCDPKILEKFDKSKARLEIKISAFFAERNLSFSLVDHMLTLFKDLFDDSKKMKDISLNRKKIPLLMIHVIAPAYKEMLRNILKKTKFSVFVDESTDISTEQSMCVLVRFFDEKKVQVSDRLWDLIKVLDGDENCKADAETLAEKIIISFTAEEVPLENIIGFCSDTCNVMFGASKSVNAILKSAIPDMKALKCGAHIAHLCARDGLKRIDGIYEQITHHISGYMKSSPNRNNRWKILQEKKGKKALKILKPFAIRWLSFYECMERIYRRWSLLEIFFKGELLINPKSEEDNVNVILDYLQSPVNKLYHIFILSIYKMIQHSNLQLQSDNTVVRTENDVLGNLYTCFLKMYINEEYVENHKLCDINPHNVSEWKPYSEFRLCKEVIEFFNAIELESVKKNFLKDCREVLLEICSKIKQRHNLDNIHVTKKFMNPQIALDTNFHDEIQNLDDILNKVPELTNNNDDEITLRINEEWKLLLHHPMTEDIKSKKNTEEFWYAVSKLTNSEGEFLFKHLSELALNMLCYPDANASSERLWSKLNIEKTYLRSNLSFETLRAALLTSEYVKYEGGYRKFEPNDDMYFRMAIKHRQPTFYKDSFDTLEEYQGIKINNEKLNQLIEKEDTFVKYTLKGQLKFENSGFQYQDSLQPSEEQLSLYSAPNDSPIYSSVSVNDDSVICFNDVYQKGFYPNGLRDDPYYYQQKIMYERGGKMYESIFALGKYSRFGKPYEAEELYSESYKSLMGKEWLEAAVISCCAAIHEREWKNCIFVPPVVVGLLFGTEEIKELTENHPLLKYSLPTKGIILMPYMYLNHWRLFMINIDEKFIAYIDPYKLNCLPFEGEEGRVVTRFVRFQALCKSYNISNSLTAINEWKVVSIYNDRPYQQQNDGNNCGVYLLYYMNKIGKKEKFDAEFDPFEHRKELEILLLSGSDSMKNVCQKCFSNDGPAPQRKCLACQRYVHELCLIGAANVINSNECELCYSYALNCSNKSLTQTKIRAKRKNKFESSIRQQKRKL